MLHYLKRILLISVLLSACGAGNSVTPNTSSLSLQGENTALSPSPAHETPTVVFSTETPTLVVPSSTPTLIISTGTPTSTITNSTTSTDLLELPEFRGVQTSYPPTSGA